MAVQIDPYVPMRKRTFSYLKVSSHQKAFRDCMSGEVIYLVIKNVTFSTDVIGFIDHVFSTHRLTTM